MVAEGVVHNELTGWNEHQLVVLQNEKWFVSIESESEVLNPLEKGLYFLFT